MYGHIATATGWTWEHIDGLTLWHVNELLDYWQDYPPTHVLVGAYLTGGRKSGMRQRNRHGNDRFLELRQAVVLAGGGVKGVVSKIYRS